MSLSELEAMRHAIKAILAELRALKTEQPGKEADAALSFLANRLETSTNAMDQGIAVQIRKLQQ